MIKIGVNSVLFAGVDYKTAAEHIALSGYDGIEISAIKGMCEHLVLDDWKNQAEDIIGITREYGLLLLAMEVASLDRYRLEKAFEAASYLGIPVINVGPGGRMDNNEDLNKSVELLSEMSDRAASYGLSLCVKAHVGASIYDTRTTLYAIDQIKSEGFGIDMDPSHIFRSGETPQEALKEVIGRVRHIHIRDCVNTSGGPGHPIEQICGKGNIDLFSYCETMVRAGYDGPVDLEIIGAGSLSLTQTAMIAAESYGYLNCCLKKLGAR